MSDTTYLYNNIYISGNLEKDIALFKNIFKKDSVLRIKRIKARYSIPLDCALIYLDGMTDADQLNEGVIKPILTVTAPFESDSVAEYVEKQVLFARDVKKNGNVAKILEGILYGEALILIDGSTTALNIDTKGWRTRGISEPEDERVRSGPREGFDEAALLNLAMIRRRLQTPDLCTEMMRVGRRTSTLVFICYLDSLVNKKTLELLKKKISKIDIDGILDSNYITEQIRDNKYSIFKTSATTERPDVVAAKLLEGRIALVVDGTPVAVTLPFLFSENFQSDEDYYLNFFISSAGRIIRYVCFLLSISTPAVFISLSTFHNQLLPTSLAVSVAQLRSGVPFSPFIECIIMIFVFEILKEAGVRMNKSLGHALSIVGALIVGQAAVDARIISTPMLIVIALSGISGLMIPRLKTAVFYLRIAFVIISALFGLYGFIISSSMVLMQVLSLTSLGTDCTVSLKKANFQSLKDTFFRAPWNFMKKRPQFNHNITRQKEQK